MGLGRLWDHSPMASPAGTNPNPMLELYRFNPLALYPMIRPDIIQIRIRIMGHST